MPARHLPLRGWVPRSCGRPVIVPPDDMVGASLLDGCLGTGGVISARRRRLKGPQPDRDGDSRDSRDGCGGSGEAPEGFEGGDATDRRSFVRAGAVSALPAVSALAAVVGDRSRDIARADPDPVSLVAVEEDVDRFAATYTAVPHAVLLPQVERRWREVDAALGRRTTLAARTRLTAAAGRLTYYLSRLAFNLGDLGAARRIAALAGLYAEQAEDEVVLSSVAGIRSGVAFYRHRYAAALDALGDGAADPAYLKARNAAYRARAHAARGDAAAARVQLDVMRRSRLGGPAEPGDVPLGEAGAAMFTGGVLLRCGEGAAAEGWAREAVAAHEAAGPRVHVEEFGHALLVLAAALLRRDRPEPDEAAALGGRVLGLLDDYPTHTVASSAGRLADELSPYRSVPAVAEFRELLGAVPRPPAPPGAASTGAS